MDVAMFVSVGLGYLGGVVAVFLLAPRIVAMALRGGPSGADRRRTVWRWAAAGGLVALLPALLLGTVVGGSLGGVYGQVASSSLGLGSAGLVPGIAGGMFAVVALTMGVAIAIGAFLGRLVAGATDDET